MPADPKTVVARFWQVMNTGDFEAASRLLAEDYLLEWPQSSERIVGRANFVAVNSRYPAQGPWRFTVNRLLTEGSEAVSDVSVTGGTLEARALTFSTVRSGLIQSETQFWPETYAAPEWRRAWVELDAK